MSRRPSPTRPRAPSAGSLSHTGAAIRLELPCFGRAVGTDGTVPKLVRTGTESILVVLLLMAGARAEEPRPTTASLPAESLPAESLPALAAGLSDLEASGGNQRWWQFRGPGPAGWAVDAELPVSFDVESGDHIGWRAEISGRSVAGPIVVADQVISLASYGLEQRWLIITSHHTDDGRLLWQQRLRATGRPYSHPTSANAAPTPVSDGRCVYAFFSSNDLVCCDLQGRLIWFRGLAVDRPQAGNDVGMSSSPILADGVLVAQVESQGDAFVIGIDADTGQTLWQIDRPRRANWASPICLTTPQNQQLVVVQSRDQLLAIEPRGGKVVWELPLACSSIASCTWDGQLLYVAAGGTTALALAEDAQSADIAWQNNRLSSNSASPTRAGELLLVLNRSVLVAADRVSGQLAWQLRLPEAGSLWASPVVAGSRLYQFTEEGDCFVVEIDSQRGQLLGRYSLGDSVLGTPAICGDAMFVRSAGALWKIAR